MGLLIHRWRGPPSLTREGIQCATITASATNQMLYCTHGSSWAPTPTTKRSVTRAPVGATIVRPSKRLPQTIFGAINERCDITCRDRRPRRSISRNFLQYEPSVTDRRDAGPYKGDQSPPLQQTKCCFAHTGRRGRRPLPRREAFTRAPVGATIGRPPKRLPQTVFGAQNKRNAVTQASLV